MNQNETSTNVPSISDFANNQNIIEAKDEKGRDLRFILLTTKQIAKVRTGKGSDVEQATIIAGGDQSKFISAMMALVTEIDGRKVIMEDLSELPMKDYMAIQLAHTDINF